MSNPKLLAIYCSNCHTRLILHPRGGYIYPIVRCGKCYSVIRIANPRLPYFGGVKLFYVDPSDPPKPPSPSPKAKKADSSKKEDDNPGIQKSQIVVSGNQVSGNKGDQNGNLSVGNSMENILINMGKIIIQHGWEDDEET